MGSGALPGKMFLVRIIENDKIYAYFWSDQVARKRRKKTRLILNNPRFIIKPGSAPDPKIVLKHCNVC